MAGYLLSVISIRDMPWSRTSETCGDFRTAGEIISAIREKIKPVTGSPADFDPLLKLIGDAPPVLPGEAPHGTHEVYRARAQITCRLIKKKVFAWR